MALLAGQSTITGEDVQDAVYCNLTEDEKDTYYKKQLEIVYPFIRIYACAERWEVTSFYTGTYLEDKCHFEDHSHLPVDDNLMHLNLSAKDVAMRLLKYEPKLTQEQANVIVSAAEELAFLNLDY